MIILKIWNALFSQDPNALRLLDRYWRGYSVSVYRMVVRPYRTTMYPYVGRPVRSCHELSWGNVFIEGNIFNLNCHSVRIQSLKLCQKINTGGTCVSILSQSDRLNLVRVHRTVNQVFYNMKNCISLREKILHYANPWSRNRQIQFTDSGSSICPVKAYRNYATTGVTKLINYPWRSGVGRYLLIAIKSKSAEMQRRR